MMCLKPPENIGVIAYDVDDLITGETLLLRALFQVKSSVTQEV